MRNQWNENAATASNVAAISSQQNVAEHKSGSILPQAEWFAVMGREIWKFKVGAALHQHTAYSDRTCRAWASAESEPPARALALCLRSSDGPKVLAYIMRDNPPEWWRLLMLARLALEIFN